MSESLGDMPVLRVNGHSLERLKAVMALTPGFPACGYAVDAERKRLVFFQYESKEMTPFPTRQSSDLCAQMAMEWLKSADYPREPDHDGDNERGWLCFTEEWGKVEPFGYRAFMAVEPHWIMYGK